MGKTLSVAIITQNDEANRQRTLQSVRWADEIVVIDSGSTDRTVEIAQSCGVPIFHEAWHGFGRQKNLAIERCSGDWVLSLDADEEVSAELGQNIQQLLGGEPAVDACFLPRRNLFLGRW